MPTGASMNLKHKNASKGSIRATALSGRVNVPHSTRQKSAGGVRAIGNTENEGNGGTVERAGGFEDTRAPAAKRSKPDAPLDVPKEESTILVLDTNVFIYWLPFLKSAIAQAIGEQSIGLHDPTGVRFCLPWRSLCDIDRLHSRKKVKRISDGSPTASALSANHLRINANEALECIRYWLLTSARCATQQKLSQSARVFYAQTIADDMRTCVRHGDPAYAARILLCVLAIPEKRRVLVTSDAALGRRAIANRIPWIDARELEAKYYSWVGPAYQTAAAILAQSIGRSDPSSPSSSVSAVIGPNRSRTGRKRVKASRIKALLKNRNEVADQADSSSAAANSGGVPNGDTNGSGKTNDSSTRNSSDAASRHPISDSATAVACFPFALEYFKHIISNP